MVPETLPSTIQHAPAAGEPTCGLPTADGGTCWRVAGHQGPCMG